MDRLLYSTKKKGICIVESQMKYCWDDRPGCCCSKHCKGSRDRVAGAGSVIHGGSAYKRETFPGTTRSERLRKGERGSSCSGCGASTALVANPSSVLLKRSEARSIWYAAPVSRWWSCRSRVPGPPAGRLRRSFALSFSAGKTSVVEPSSCTARAWQAHMERLRHERACPSGLDTQPQRVERGRE